MKQLIFLFSILIFSFFVKSQSFIENKGQILNQSGKINSDVLFLFNDQRGLNFQLKQNGFSYDIYQKANGKIDFNRIDIEFVNCNSDIAIIASNQRTDYLNYYKSGLQASVGFIINQYQTITYKNVYPNIDIVFNVSNQNQAIKYDIILHPGANINDIKFRYTGIDGYDLDSKNGLELTTRIRTLTEQIPLSYYEGNQNAIEKIDYKIIETNINTILVGFESKSPLKLSKTLIIDPVPTYVWGKYIGDSLSTSTNGVITDRFSNVYICGSTQSLQNIATSGAYQTTMSDSINDAYLTKYNKFGSKLWSTYFGGLANDVANDVYVDTSFNVFLTGTTFSNTGIVDSLGNQDSLYGNGDTFLAKFNSNGGLEWSTYFGGDSTDVGTKLSTDFNQNVYVCGHTFSTNNIAVNAFQPVLNGNNDGFVAKFDSVGVLQWSSYIGGSDVDVATGISFGDTSVYISGYTFSTDLIVSNTVHQSSLNGIKDGFLTHVSESGNLLWTTYYGGEGFDNIQSVKTFNNNVYFVGSTSSDSSITAGNSFQLIKGDTIDAVIGKFNREGDLMWSSYFGGDSIDIGADLFFELDSNIIAVGSTNSINLPFIDTTNSYQTQLGGESDAFLTKISKTGQMIWSTYHGGENNEKTEAVAVYGNTGIYVVGSTLSDSSVVQPNQNYGENVFNSSKEGFFTKFKQGKSTYPSGLSSGGGSGNQEVYHCPGDSVLLTIQGGDLGTDANWMWYAGQCGNTNSIGTGDSLWVTPTVSTAYFVRSESVTNAGDCVSKIVYVAPINPVQIVNDTLACAQSDFVLETNYQSGSVQWSGPNGFSIITFDTTLINIDQTYEGVYSVVATDTFGCVYTDSIELFVVDGPQVNIDYLDVSCFGYNDGEIILTGDSISNYQINWSIYVDSTLVDFSTHDSLLNLYANEYFLTVTDNNNCFITDSILISQPPSVLIDTLITPTACSDSTGTILVTLDSSVTGGYTVIWSPTTQSGLFATDLNYGWHNVTIIQENKCSEEHSFFVPNINKLEVSIDSVLLTLCEGTPTGSATAIGQNGLPPYWYEWNGVSQTNPTINNLDTGLYIVVIHDDAGCIAMDSVNIQSQYNMSINAQIVNALCSEATGSILVNIQHDSIPFNFTFSNGISNEFYLDSLTAGFYTLYVTDSIGCEFERSYTVDLINDLNVSITPSDTTIEMGTSVPLTVSTNYFGNFYYAWSPSTDLSCDACQSPILTPMNAEFYEVIVTDSLGCTDTASVNIDISIPCIEVFIPTLFSPNDDGLNDEWHIIGTCISSINTKVYNQWGELIFESNNQNNGWDGIYLGQLVPNDQYTYSVNVIYENGNTENFSGFVTVVN